LGENYSLKREKALTALMTNPTIKGAAEECGIAEKTLHAWLNEEDFASKVKAAQEEVTRQAIGRILLSIGRSIETLEEIMQDATNNASPRVRCWTMALRCMNFRQYSSGWKPWKGG